MTRPSRKAAPPAHVTRGNVFDDLGFSRAEASSLKIRWDLHRQILRIVGREGYGQRDLEKLLGQPQSRVSELLSGKISRLKLDTLLQYLDRLGARTEIRVRYPRRAA